MKEQGHKLMEKVSDKRDEFITKWEERSREFVNSFVGLFGKDGRIVSPPFVKQANLQITHRKVYMYSSYKSNQIYPT